MKIKAILTLALFAVTFSGSLFAQGQDCIAKVSMFTEPAKEAVFSRNRIACGVLKYHF